MYFCAPPALGSPSGGAAEQREAEGALPLFQMVEDVLTNARKALIDVRV